MRILLVPDVPNWAWDFKADALKKYLSDRFEFGKCYVGGINTFDKSTYDTLHFFGYQDGFSRAGYSTCGISSHGFYLQNAEISRVNLPRYMAITTVSRELYDILKKRNCNKNIYLCENGVDETIFYPPDKPIRNKKLVIGWVGKPPRNKAQKDFHGWNQLYTPLSEEIRKNSKMEVREVCRIYTNALSRDEMREFYQNIDVLIHTGNLVGTPNPVFEAASCGTISVTTKVGAAMGMVEDHVNGYIIEKEFIDPYISVMVDDFMIRLKFLCENRELCQSMGVEARKTIEKDWTWREKAKQWIPVFENHRRGV